MAIDLTRLPPPAIMETIDYESLLAEYKAKLLTLVPAEQRAAIAATLQLESEPLLMALQLACYREMLLRQRINEAARASLLAYAEREDLDNRAADYGVQRLLIQPAQPDANPPTEAQWESDERLRMRCQMAMEGLASAGPRGAYAFHAFSASADVADVDVDTPAGGTVRVWLLGRDGAASSTLCNTVAAALNAEDVRPLCDTVDVRAAAPLSFAIEARIEYQPGGEAVSGGLAGANLRLSKMLAERRKIRGSVPRSAIDAALHVPGVNRVILTSPAADVQCGVGQFPSCAGLSVVAS
ncbi:baseplate J/gp47 family protein [Chromobacterium sp. IIBBL 290-4]|uniref:baseplate assembly protein n=1 Tax=Chromobacterium sp. IIBBL 290-4 TaxID=2953890 RepID=UPI0020B6E002|nr:baseplate J/gp47 family protein [Chromobacterium sp. IIBBL 290-4]UTH73343.1 baseplate J/gp47 family protein [Chromobacterium sp. IIBBL 290-4]